MSHRFWLLPLILPFFITLAHAQNSSAGITPCGPGITLSVTTSSSNAQLNACGGTAIIWNLGSNEAFINLGSNNSTTATTSNWSIPSGAGVTINTGKAPLYIAAITGSSTATLRIVQGNGGPAIAGGGSGGGGGGGGAVTIADGADVAEGATTDAAATAGGTGSVSAKLRLMTTQLGTLNTSLGTINTTLGSPFQAGGSIGNTTFASTQSGTWNVGVSAGSNIIGKVGIDQSSIGTTNAVALNYIGPTNIATGNGVVGTGVQRVAIASDNTAFTVNLGTLNGASTAANQTAIQAPVAPATATATKSVLLGAQATTSAVNPTTGQQGALSSDTNNNLLVSAGGAPNLATTQVSVTTSDTSVAAARALRRSITVQQITGTQQVFCSQTTATTSNGILLPAVVGASFTLNTTSAIRCITATGSSQTVAVAETY